MTLLLGAACTSHSTTADPTATPTLPTSPTASGTTSATPFAYPDDAGKISPLPVPDAFDGELARKDNNLSPGLRTATITVTVPAGKVIASDLICQGRGEVAVKTQPKSDAEQTISCDGSELPSQLGVFASDPVKVATRFVFTLTASGPSRWLLAVSARDPQ